METTANVNYNTSSEANSDTTVATRIAGEDIRRGDYVSVLNEVLELPSFLWSCTDLTRPIDELVRTRIIPPDAGQPYKVIAICLPFVYTKRPKGRTVTFDTRQQQLVRLDAASGSAVWKAMKQAGKKRK